jgi:cytochrome c oxidase subunit 2
MKKLQVVLLVILVLIIVMSMLLSGIFRAKNSSTNNIPTPTPSPKMPSQRTFVIYVRNWEFEPSEIRVKKNDNVKLQIKSLDVEHGMLLKEFKLQSVLRPFTFVTLQFKADKQGVFRYVCTINCGPKGAEGMYGTLIVD